MAASVQVRFDLLQGADIDDFIASSSSSITKKVIRFAGDDEPETAGVGEVAMPPEPDRVPPEDQPPDPVANSAKSGLMRRPDRCYLSWKGSIQEEKVFGKDIGKICELERSTVPVFVKMCIDHIDKHGLRCDGIYRAKGNGALIQKLRSYVDQDCQVDLESSPWKEDIHVITGALRIYFRELPEPLFAFATYNRFITEIPQVGKWKRDAKIDACKQLFSQMPRPNQDTIKTLFSHLKRVLSDKRRNGLTEKKLAAVFGPAVMWTYQDTSISEKETVDAVVEFILHEFDTIFGDKAKKK